MERRPKSSIPPNGPFPVDTVSNLVTYQPNEVSQEARAFTYCCYIQAKIARGIYAPQVQYRAKLQSADILPNLKLRVHFWKSNMRSRSVNMRTAILQVIIGMRCRVVVGSDPFCGIEKTPMSHINADENANGARPISACLPLRLTPCAARDT
jgi:hypothetical protein